MKQHDIILGHDLSGRKFLKLGGDTHVAVVAPTRSGKSSSFSIPAAFSWQGSMICLDIKGEIYDATSGYRASIGQTIRRFDPAGVEEKTHRINPFATIERADKSRFRDMSRMGYLLFPEPINARGADWYWEDVSRRAFRSVSLCLAETREEHLAMSNVLRYFSRAGGIQELGERVRTAYRRGKPYSRTVSDGISSILAADERTYQGILTTVSARLDIWSEPATAAATDASDFDIRDIRREPTTIYLVVTPGDIERMSPLLRLFFGLVINLNTLATPEQDSSLKWQTLLLLDEFARLGRIARVGHFLQYAGGYGFRVAMIVQDKSQVRELYGPHAAADIFDNAATHIYLSGMGDGEAAKELERRLGTDTVQVTSSNRPRFMAWARPSRQTEGEAPHGRPLMLAQEIIGMPADQEIILRPGMRPVLAKKIRWWQEKAFTSLVRPPPEVPALKIDVPLDDGSAQIRRPARTTSGLTQSDMSNAFGC